MNDIHLRRKLTNFPVASLQARSRHPAERPGPGGGRGLTPDPGEVVRSVALLRPREDPAPPAAA